MRVLLLFTFLMTGFGAAAQRKDTVPAHYPGGQGAWMRYLIREFRVPAGVEPNQQSARLVFDVSSKGNISNIRMISGDTALLKTFNDLLIKSGPWGPAMVGRKAVASVYTLPINYHLEYEP